jgi:hypothetical protein
MTRATQVRSRHRVPTPISLILAVGIGAVALSGCGVLNAVRKVQSAVETNKHIVNSFTTNLKASAARPFEVTYESSGSAPTTVVYAVDPPHDVAFTTTPAGRADEVAAIDLVVNASGEYACTRQSSTTAESCAKLPAEDAASQNAIVDFYTPAHWVSFLQGFSLAAGFAGDKVSTSQMTVDGFSMRCVDFIASGVPGRSTICTTAEGVLGYVKVAGSSTSFSIKSYSNSPNHSLFVLPAGAKVTTVTVPAAPTTSS